MGTFVTAEGLNVDVANVSGKIKANSIDATELVVYAGKIDGKLTASQIDVTDLKVTSANIDHLYAGDLELGNSNPNGGSYIPSGVISNGKNYLDSLYVTTLTNKTFNGGNIGLSGSEDGISYSVIITATGVTVSSSGATGTFKSWQDILSGGVAKFG